jgi:hypothetical protein
VTGNVETICDHSRRALPAFGGTDHLCRQPAGPRPRHAIDPSKLERELGWKAEENFETGIARTVRWYLDQEPWKASLEPGYTASRVGLIVSRRKHQSKPIKAPTAGIRDIMSGSSELLDGRAKTLLELKCQIKQLFNDSTPENHERFFSKFSISNQQRLDFVGDTLSSFQTSLSDDRIGQTSTSLSQKLIHRLWLTNPKNPSSPPKSYLERIDKQRKRLSDEYQCVFWHNSEQAASMLSEHFPEVDITFRHIHSLSTEPRLLERIDSAISYQKYVLAGDISKYLILKEIGGIYADLGVDFGKPLLDLVLSGDVALFLDSGLFFQPAFMAAPPNSYPFRVWCSLLSQPEVMSSIGLQDSSGFTAGNEIWIHGGVGFTAALILFYDGSYRVLAVPPNRGLLHHESQGSWYKPGNRYGNVSLASAPITHLNWDKHLRQTELNQQTNARLSHLSDASKARLTVAQHLERLHWLR